MYTRRLGLLLWAEVAVEQLVHSVYRGLNACLRTSADLYYPCLASTVCIGYRLTGYKNIPATVILVRNIKSKTYFIQYKYHYNQYYRM